MLKPSTFSLPVLISVLYILHLHMYEEKRNQIRLINDPGFKSSHTSYSVGVSVPIRANESYLPISGW